MNTKKVYPEMLLKQKTLLLQYGIDFDSFQLKGISERENLLFNIQDEYLGNEKPVNQITPVVSVCIPTYQQVDYIKDCIESAIMQETSFPIEIIIGDDGSIDGTTEIGKQYAEKFPDKIRLYNRSRELCRIFDNEGHIIRSCNWWWTLRKSRAKYIAICEGDDYWIDPLKLQKQVDCLNHNSDVALVFSNRIIINEVLGSQYMRKYRKTYYSSKDLLGGEVLGLQTICVRKEYVDGKYSINADIEIPYSSSSHGRLYCLPDATAVYRITGKGVATSRKPEQVLTISLQQMWDFHKAYNFPSKSLLIKAQTRYVFADLVKKLKRKDYMLSTSMKKMLSYYNQSSYLKFYAFTLMNVYVLYFLVKSIYEKKRK